VKEWRFCGDECLGLGTCLAGDNWDAEELVAPVVVVVAVVVEVALVAGWIELRAAIVTGGG
jgi:hypothetical protein